MNSFADLPLITALRQSVEAAGYVQPTSIQAQTLPAILEGRDILALAPTGSGKTAAFGLGLLQRLDAERIETQGLVLCPSRELADQVAKELRRLAMAIPNVKISLLIGGVPLGPQIASLAHAPHIVVGTPGRVQELIGKSVLQTSQINMLVLDEADRMLDMGFEESIAEILGTLPESRQSLLFSASFPDAIRAMGRKSLREPLEVQVDEASEQPIVEHWFHEVTAQNKAEALVRLLLQHRPESSLVFCNTRRDVDALAETLNRYRFYVAALHGDMEQRDREEILLRFANRSTSVLVASDVAARGLDIRELACVVNYDMPSDSDTYLHRVGRTARAGQRGLALNLVTAEDMPRARKLEQQNGLELRWAPIKDGQIALDKVPRAAMGTLRIDAGRVEKIRPGDILGALTGSAGLSADQIGKIDIFPTRSYVAVAHDHVGAALSSLQAGKIKGRKLRVKRI